MLWTSFEFFGDIFAMELEASSCRSHNGYPVPGLSGGRLECLEWLKVDKRSTSFDFLFGRITRMSWQ